jgi:hypothetical protein
MAVRRWPEEGVSVPIVARPAASYWTGLCVRFSLLGFAVERTEPGYTDLEDDGRSGRASDPSSLALDTGSPSGNPIRHAR